MKRVRANILVLVNWKGIFYERYSLDKNVTALEGDNGAGKTTIMIAAYVVLLPDMTRLRFTNVGEGDATGGDKGIWGRLGNPNRPSYALVAFDLGGEQVLAGVQLERKGEPSVELTPFLISQLPAEVRLQDALLLKSHDEDLVPELGDLKENVARFGGRMQVFKTAKEYFVALFDHGITPLRLVGDEERTRFNDMLRTSMTGGISRALTSEFRSFLLKEESGLADTLIRMRSNLDACRRTRTEVKEAQELEQEISGVYEAGHEMFAAALLATRERAEELRRRVQEAKQLKYAAQQEHDRVAHELGEETDKQIKIKQRLTKKTTELDEAQRHHERVSAANAIAKRIADFDRELRELVGQLQVARLKMSNAENLKAIRRSEQTRAQEAYRRAAEGLADLQQGQAELHRRADAHRTVMARLGEARAALDRQNLTTEDLESHETSTRVAMAAIDRQRNEVDAAVGSAEVQRIDHAEALRALTSILGRDVTAADAYIEAKKTLRHLSDLESRAAQIEGLEEELERIRSRCQQQQIVRAKAEELSLPGMPLTSSHQVHEAFRKADNDVQAAMKRLHDEESSRGECLRKQQDLLEKQVDLHDRAVAWQELDAVAARLEVTLGPGLRTATGLNAARDKLDQEHDDIQRRLQRLLNTRSETEDRARNLEQTGGDFHHDLLAARDVVEGELLATHFDDVSPTQAGPLQARLGPLADAIVVEKAREAAKALVGHKRELETIWLVEEGGLHNLVAPENADGDSQQGTTDVIVEQDGVVRTTRVSSKPTLGKKARQRLIAELYAQVQELSDRTVSLETQLAENSSYRRDIELLTREVTILQLGDPAPDMAQVAKHVEELEDQIKAHSSAAEEAQQDLNQLSPRKDVLSKLLANAIILDEPDLTGKVSDLERAHRFSVDARATLECVSDARQILDNHIDALRRLPLSPAEIMSMQDELKQLGTRRERLFCAVQALEYVIANRYALTWTDAEEALSIKQELVPALKIQCDQAKDELDLAIKAVQQAETEWEEIRAVWREIDDRRSALEASRERDRLELAEKNVDDPSDAAVERTRATIERLNLLVKELDQVDRDADRTIAQLNERLKVREERLHEAEEHLLKEEREWKPAEDLWGRLRAKAESDGLLSPAITARLLNVGSGSVNLRSEARSWGKSLDERLGRAKGGQEILDRIRSSLSDQEQTTGEDYLQAWEIVRDWLHRRVPAQIAEVDDPLEALERLKHRVLPVGEHESIIAGELYCSSQNR